MVFKFGLSYFREHFDEELKSRLDSLSKCMCSERLPKILSLNKGRHMLVRTFSLLDSSQQLLLFEALISKSLSTTLKVIPEDEVKFLNMD